MDNDTTWFSEGNRSAIVISEAHEEEGIRLVAWKWHEVGVYLAPVLFLVLSGLAKLMFHYVRWLSSRVPESCLLILIGLLYGFIMSQVGLGQESKDIFPRFSPDLFFYILLPPIILEAAYSLYSRVFLDNLRTILLFAVVGTILNFLMIGGLLILMQTLGAMGPMPLRNGTQCHNCSLNGTEDARIDLGAADIFLFSSLISAVDPVAVLAIFSEIGVNADLYFLVFGESLLNDGVAVVLYNMMKAFATMEEIPPLQYVLAICSFLTVALGGLLVGIIFGFLTALITRVTKEVQVMEPLAMFGMAYLSYYSADMLDWSGIISIIGCGLVQAHYSFKNISENSYTTVKYFIKMLSSTNDCMIFLYLGIALTDSQVWHLGFTCWTLLFCLVVRFVVVFIQIFLVNKVRVKKIVLHEQFIIAYGGLRGAVGFSLVSLINKNTIEPANMFVTTTLVVVMFTVFLQGGTIKYLVKLLKIDLDKSKDGHKTINEEINNHLMEHIMSGIDIVSGKRGHFYIENLLEHYDEMYLMKWFCRPDYHQEITRVFEEVALSDHLINLYGHTVVLDERKSGHINDGLEQDENDEMTSNPIKDNMETQMPKEEREFLSRALNENPYKNLHKPVNRNIINGDEQELKTHVRRRRDKTRKISLLAMKRHVGGSIEMENTAQFEKQNKPEQKNEEENACHNKARGLIAVRDKIDTSEDDVDGKDVDIAKKLEKVPATQRAGVAAVLQIHAAKRSAKIWMTPSKNQTAMSNKQQDKTQQEYQREGRKYPKLKRQNDENDMKNSFYEMDELNGSKL